jgi:hypothetical protein
MRRHWKDLAERAAQEIFSPDQVSEALLHALKRDILGAPLDAIQDIIGCRKQGSLFPEQRIEHLEILRQSCRGSAAANAVIDCAVEIVRNELTGEAAYRSVLQNALEDITRSALRMIEEHYHREGSECSAKYVRGRLDTARDQFDFSILAEELMSSGIPPRGSINLPRHTGLDEGPPL